MYCSFNIVELCWHYICDRNNSTKIRHKIIGICVFYCLYILWSLLQTVSKKAVGLKGIYYQLKLAPLIPHILYQRPSAVIFCNNVQIYFHINILVVKNIKAGYHELHQLSFLYMITCLFMLTLQDIAFISTNQFISIIASLIFISFCYTFQQLLLDPTMVQLPEHNNWVKTPTRWLTPHIMSNMLCAMLLSYACTKIEHIGSRNMKVNHYSHIFTNLKEPSSCSACIIHVFIFLYITSWHDIFIHTMSLFCNSLRRLLQ